MAESRRVAAGALLLLPTGLMAYFAFDSGGFHPGPPAYAAIVLCAVLLLRVTLAKHPFAGFGLPLALAGGALSLYALWTLLSEAWSHAPGNALVEFDRALVYLLTMILFGSIAHSSQRLRWMLRALAAGIVVVCTCGLLTRLLPHLWPITPEIANSRLSFPVTYWNVLGLLAALGIVLCLHLASDRGEPSAARVLGAGAAPVLAVTLYFTFSRGAIAAAIVAVIAYVLVGRPRLLASGLIATAPATALALKFAYDSNVLATPTPTTPEGVVQGHRVAVAVLACAIGAAVVRAVGARILDRPLERFSLPREWGRLVPRATWGAAASALIIAAIAFNGTIAHAYHLFVKPVPRANRVDLRERLTDPGNNGRIDAWRVAWREFKVAPLAGQGAGTFQNSYAQYRRSDQFVVDAHSLYAETLDELGIVGFVLLLSVIVAVLVRVLMRARGSRRPLYAALFATFLAWALQSGFDWDWEMPVVTVLFFALGGFALARHRRSGRRVGSSERFAARSRRSRGRTQPTVLAPQARAVLGLGCVVLAVAPTFVWLSQRKLDQASYAFSEGDCPAATQAALSSISILGIRPEPYEVVGYCDIRRNMPNLAIAAVNKAISLDPNNWNYHYDLAVMRAAAGLNPLGAARRTLSLDSREPLVQNLWRALSTDRRAQWRSDGRAIADRLTSL